MECRRVQKWRVFLKSEHIADPMYARYAWKPYLEPNLINEQGLPASPFTTNDDFLKDD